MEKLQPESYSEQPSSALGEVRIDHTPIVHSDARRAAVEIFSSTGIIIRDAKILMVEQPIDGKESVIGGHWEKGLEIIYVQQGEIATLKLADVNTGDEVSYGHVSAGTRIILPAGVAHQFRFREAATLLVFNEVPFTPEKLVIYPPWGLEEGS